MRLQPFGQRRKTYFYGVAGFVLAAHVVVGAIFHVMPPEFDEPGSVVPVEVQIIDHLLPDVVVESSAVQMVEEAVHEEEKPPVFVPVWEPSPVAPELEPLGPTETVLPEVVIEEPSAGVGEMGTETADEPGAATEITKPNAGSTPTPAADRNPTPSPDKPSPKTKKSVSNRAAPKPPVKKASVPPRDPEPKVLPEPEPVIERAIPVRPAGSGRTGIINRLRKKPSKRMKSEPYMAATWSKRPPPYYPYEARKRGVEGTAHVRVSIDSRGRITSSRLAKSSGNELLDEAALASVKKGELSPARRGGRGVSSEMLVPFEFYLP